MSYDLQVFAPRSLSRDELQDLVMAAGLAVEPPANDHAVLTVLRGARGRYSFTLGLPVAIEAEDVPEEVTAVLLAPSFLYEIGVEGSSPAETVHAVRFARRLALASGGVVLDQQTGRTWFRGRLRRSEPVQKGKIAVVELTWYLMSQDRGASGTRAWLDAARRHLPEALPRRFGPVEPLAMRLDTHGPQALLDVVAEDDLGIFLTTQAPCVGGHLAGGAGADRVRSYGLCVLRDSLEDPGWRDALRRFFIAFATAAGASFASAEVQRDVSWSGRSLSYGFEVEEKAHMLRRGEWEGLPPYPVWWSWFGPDYVPLVADHLPRGEVQMTGGGLFHGRDTAPRDRDQLLADLRAAALHDLVAGAAPRTWLPPELLATWGEGEANVRPTSLVPAPVVPPALRPAPAGSPSGRRRRTP